MTEEHDPISKTLADLRAWHLREGTYAASWPVQSPESTRWRELRDILRRLHEELGYDYSNGVRVRAVKALGTCGEITDDQIAKRVATVTARQKPRAHANHDRVLEVGFDVDVAWYGHEKLQLKEEKVQDVGMQATVKAVGVPVALETEDWDDALVTMRAETEDE